MEEVEKDNLDNIFGTDEEEERVSTEGSEGENISDEEDQSLTKKSCLSLLKSREVNLRRLSAPRHSGRKVILFFRLTSFYFIV